MTDNEAVLLAVILGLVLGWLIAAALGGSFGKSYPADFVPGSRFRAGLSKDPEE
jgi:xanthine/uracil permease